MFDENNFDLDLDENVFSFPASDGTSKSPDASSPNRTEPFKRPSIIRGREINQKRVVQRKFPGPAGLLPTIHDDLNITDDGFNEPGGVNNSDDLLVCSQASLSMFQEEPWTMMCADFRVENKYTIKWIKSNATGKTLVNQKAPFLAAVVKSVECTRLKVPTLTLKDPTDEIQADISHDLYEEHVNDLTVGSVIVLRHFSVFSVKNETAHHLTVTSNNLVAIYNKQRRCRLDFASRKVNREPFSISTKRLATPDSCGLKTNKELGDNARPNKKFTNKQSSSELSPKIAKANTSTLKFYAPSNLICGSNSLHDLDEADLNLSLELFSQEVLTDVDVNKIPDAVKTPSRINQRRIEGNDVAFDLTAGGEFDANSPGDRCKPVADEESPPSKKLKTTLSQKFRQFRFCPKGDSVTEEGCCASKDECKDGGNFLDCSQISFVSQNKEDHDILQDVFQNVDAELLFEEF